MSVILCLVNVWETLLYWPSLPPPQFSYSLLGSIHTWQLFYILYIMCSHYLHYLTSTTLWNIYHTHCTGCVAKSWPWDKWYTRQWVPIAFENVLSLRNVQYTLQKRIAVKLASAPSETITYAWETQKNKERKKGKKKGLWKSEKKKLRFIFFSKSRKNVW